MTPAGLKRLFNPAGVLVGVGAIALWQVLIDTKILDFSYLPAPDEVATALGDQFESGALTTAVGHTLWVTLVASAIAMVLGVALGLALGLLPVVRTYSMASVDFFRALPMTAMIPAILLIWGPTAKAEIIAATYAATWQIVVNTAGGVRSVHPRLRDVARTFQLTRGELVRKVIIPAATPAMLVGGRLAIVTALVVAIVAEMLVNPEGIGWGLVSGQQSLQPAITWAYVAVAGAIGYVLNAVLVWAVRRALPGGGANIGAAMGAA